MREPFEAAVEQHGMTVLRVCRAVLGRVDADDAWQETFLAALRAWPTLDEGTNVEAWLVTVAYRKAIDQVRAEVRRATTSAVDLAALPGADGRPGEDHLIWEAVAQLPERQRLAVACHYLGGLPHAETAALIGGTPAAARRASADGVAALRRRMSPDDYQERS